MLRIRNLTRNTVLAVSADVADTSSKRRTGLLKHKCLPAGEGLWIAPCEGIHTIGMKFPIDVLFLDKKRKVLKVRTDMQPGRLAFCLRAYSVLELPAGTSAATETTVGDLLQFENLPSPGASQGAVNSRYEPAVPPPSSYPGALRK